MTRRMMLKNLAAAMSAVVLTATSKTENAVPAQRVSKSEPAASKAMGKAA